jgi:hypothetical protein
MTMRLDPARARIAEVPDAARITDRGWMNAGERASGSAAYYIDVVDRVLDKGIVIEAWMRMSVGGIDLITVDARVIVASIDTYMRSWPAFDGAVTMATRSMIADRLKRQDGPEPSHHVPGGTALR